MDADEAGSPWLWLGRDRKGRVALFEAPVGSELPPGAAWLVGPHVDAGLERDCQLAWLSTRPLIEISANDDLESLAPGMPAVALVEAFEVAQPLAARGGARILAEGTAVRVFLGPRAQPEDVAALRSSDAYVGSMGVDEDAWREGLSEGLMRFRRDADGRYVRQDDGAPALPLELFSEASRAGIVGVDADFERGRTVPAEAFASEGVAPTPEAGRSDPSEAPPAEDPPPGSATSSARAPDPTAPSRRRTGCRCSAARRGSASRTASGISTTSPSSSPT